MSTRPLLPPPSFPTRRSSDLPLVLGIGGRPDELLRRIDVRRVVDWSYGHAARVLAAALLRLHGLCELREDLVEVPHDPEVRELEDRKSTRLNSSHVAISYAVF